MTEMRGIVLAGGRGTRLDPLTRVTSKQLLPVYNRPMIFYPLATLMRSGIQHILIISSPEHLEDYRQLLGTGERWGVLFRYAAQPQPEGIAQALLIGREFIGGDPVALILGDNIFDDRLRLSPPIDLEARIFTYPVKDPSRYGVLWTDTDGRAISIVEKPLWSESDQAITGVYCYAPVACDLAATLKPSGRRELEISDLNRLFLHRNTLQVAPAGSAWFDCGTFDDLLAAGQWVQAMERRNAAPLADLDAIARANGWIPVGMKD